MNISVDTSLPFPLPLVYLTYRDKVSEIVPYLPNVRSLELKSRQETNGQVQTVLDWHGGGDIPVALRSILGENMLSWTEYDTWNEADFTVDWRVETHAFSEAVICGGKNRFIEYGNTTLVQSRGTLTIDPKHLKGFPPFMVGGIARMVEEFLGQKITPNLEQMGEGVRQYLTRSSAT